MTSWVDMYGIAAERLAWAALPLLVEPAEWIQRRVENITVTSQRLVRRAVSVDLVLPRDSERQELRVDKGDATSPLAVPLGLLRKEQLIDFELTEGSAPLMLVRSALGARVAAAIMVHIAQLEHRTPASTTAALPWLERIAGADKEDARLAFEQLFRDGADVPREAHPLAAGNATVALAEQLRDSYLLLVEVPETGARRRLIRFATDQEVAGETGSIAQRLGLATTPIDLSIPGASQAASYHAEVSVPSGCVLTAARVLDGEENIRTSAHLGGRRATAYPAVRLSEQARLQLEVGQERSFYFLPAAVISVLVSAVLAAGVAVAWAGGAPQATASALLLSGLSVVTGLVIGLDEEALTTELHGLARGLLIGVTAAALGAATSIALGATGHTLAALWTAALAVSVLGAAILTVGAIRSAHVRRQDRETTT